MYTAFLSVALACGVPGLMAALALGERSPARRLAPLPCFVLLPCLMVVRW
jgi:hypothetical protein